MPSRKSSVKLGRSAENIGLPVPALKSEVEIPSKQYMISYITDNNECYNYSMFSFTICIFLLFQVIKILETEL